MESRLAHSPDKPEPKVRSKKASHAKPQRTQRNLKTWFKTHDLVFLCELGAFAQKFFCRFEKNLISQLLKKGMSLKKLQKAAFPVGIPTHAEHKRTEIVVKKWLKTAS